MTTMDGNESPIEDIFSHEFMKHSLLLLKPQEWIRTSAGNMRLDFLVDGEVAYGMVNDGDMPAWPKPYRIAIECDGAEFHDAFRDEIRDAVALGDGHLDVIYRLPGRAIYHHLSSCLYYMTQWDPWLFEKRSVQVLKRAAELEGSDIDTAFSKIGEYSPCLGSGNNFSAGFTRRIARRDGSAQHWRHLYAFAKAHGGTIDKVHEARLAEHAKMVSKSKTPPPPPTASGTGGPR